MVNNRSYIGNTMRLVSDFATLECKIENLQTNIAFIKQGFVSKLHLTDLVQTFFLITNKTKFSILAGIHNHLLSSVDDKVCQLGDSHVIKPFETVKFKVPTLIHNSKIQFYTIASKVNDVNTYTYIPTSSDEYLPCSMNQSTSFELASQQCQDELFLEFNSFDTVLIDTSL